MSDFKPEFLVKNEPARLIPVGADSAREMKATSVVLAGLMSVSEFGRRMLSLLGAPATKTARIMCYTEVVFQSVNVKEKLRPDGLIIVKVGSKIWQAIVETKIGNSDLGATQIEGYLDLAKRYGIDAVITISNQYAALPTHHPVRVNGHKLRSVDLFHLSWSAIVSEAIILAEHKGISDPEQAYILKEIIRYLNNDKSGVSTKMRMSSDWKAVCEGFRSSVQETLAYDAVTSVVTSWHQVGRYMALELSKDMGVNVSASLSSKHRADPNLRIQDDVKYLCDEGILYAELKVPDTAGALYITVDLNRRAIEVSMWLKAPKDKKRSTACVTWLLKQLESCEDENINILATYSRSTLNSSDSLGKIRSYPKAILPDDLSILPTWFEIKSVSNSVQRFMGVGTFVEEVLGLVSVYYGNVGENLTAWVPSPPRIIPNKKGKIAEEDRVQSASEREDRQKNQGMLRQLIDRLPLQ